MKSSFPPEDACVPEIGSVPKLYDGDKTNPQCTPENFKWSLKAGGVHRTFGVKGIRP